MYFDNRGTQSPEPEIAEAMHRWALSEGRFERVAMIFESERLVIRVNMEGIANARKIRAFTTVELAVAWLESER